MKVRLFVLLAVLAPLSACGGLPAFGLEDAGTEAVAEAGATTPEEAGATPGPLLEDGGSEAGSPIDASTEPDPPLAADAASVPDAPVEAAPSSGPGDAGPGDATSPPPTGVPCGATVCAAPLVCCSSGKGGARCQEASTDCN
ncbi:MAG TPA: hypothetical protein VGI39_37685 [Polyangiaceae bacterium]